MSEIVLYTGRYINKESGRELRSYTLKVDGDVLYSKQNVSHNEKEVEKVHNEIGQVLKEEISESKRDSENLVTIINRIRIKNSVSDGIATTSIGVVHPIRQKEIADLRRVIKIALR